MIAGDINLLTTELIEMPLGWAYGTSIRWGPDPQMEGTVLELSRPVSH